MSKSNHYTPPLSRFNVCALYHQAKQLGIPMTQLANALIASGLKESPGWKQAQDQMRLRERASQYQKIRTTKQPQQPTSSRAQP